MANNWKKAIDINKWRPVASTPNAHAAGMGICCDLRNDVSRNPFVYQLASATVLNRYNIIHKAWNFVSSPALAGTFGAGAGCVFAPSLGIVGAIGAGCTTSKIITTTTLTAVGINMLANRGGSGDYGYKIRIFGNTAGGSGKIEERWIVANTGGTTPTIFLDTPLTFTPASGSRYEIVAGRVFMLNAGTTASNIWRSFEVSTNTLSSGLSTTNLPATISTNFSAVALDEQYNPYNMIPGEGMIIGSGTYDASGTSKRCLVATATASGTLTGQASSGDAVIPANWFRNFQIRIVEDTAAPTAVGQRRMIASNTAGASPVYTLGTAWTVTPSATAKYVIELPNLILVRTTALAAIHVYNYSADAVNNGTNSIAANSWSATFFGSSGSAMGAGSVTLPAYGITPDVNFNINPGMVYCLRGANTSTIDVLNIAGGTTGSWDNAIVYDGAVTLTTGSCGKYSPFGNEGRFGYINSYAASVINQMYRFDVKNRVMSPVSATDWIQAGTAAAGDRVATYCAIDGTDLYDVVLLVSHLATNSFELCVTV